MTSGPVAHLRRGGGLGRPFPLESPVRTVPVLLAACLAFPSLCGAASSSIDPRVYAREIAGARTEVMVLGSPHLSSMPDAFRAERLDPLLARLQAFAPAIITIEALSGEECDLLRRHPAIYPGVAETYCADNAAARKATGLDVPEAIAEVEKTLDAWPATPTPAQRRRLAALQLAANDAVSAYVQWLQLPAAERRAGDGIDDALLARMGELATSKNENLLIGAALAARLGLQRVYRVDDHTADAVYGRDGDRVSATMQRVWEPAAGHPLFAKMKQLEAGDDMLALYRFVNAPEAQRMSVEVDFGAALGEPSPERDGRRYVAWWETRNLRMVANIRAACARDPGKRVLSIVGASHKPYFDAYLAPMHDIDVVDVAPWLR